VVNVGEDTFMSYEVIKIIKGHTYLYEVHSERDGDRVRQVFDAYLGRADGGGRSSRQRASKTKESSIDNAIENVISSIIPTINIEPKEVVEKVEPEVIEANVKEEPINKTESKHISEHIILYRGIGSNQKKIPTYLTPDINFAKSFSKNIEQYQLTGKEKVADFTIGNPSRTERMKELGFTQEEIDKSSSRDGMKNVLKSKGFEIEKMLDTTEDGKLVETYVLLSPEKYKPIVAEDKPAIIKPEDKPVIEKEIPKEIVAKPKYLYHGSDTKFDTFKTGKSESGEAIFLTDAFTAEEYGKYIYEVKTDDLKTFEYDAKGAKWFTVPQSTIISQAKRDGYDAVVFKNIIDDKYHTGVPSDVTAIINPDKLKVNDVIDTIADPEWYTKPSKEEKIITKEPELKTPDVKGLITYDTNKLDRYERIYGLGDFDKGEITTFHVTDNPDNVINTLKSGGDITKTRSEGLVGDLGTSGLYVSDAPQIWTSRSKGKWNFLNELSNNEKDKLIDQISTDIKQQLSTDYITKSEYDTAIRDLGNIRSGDYSNDVLVNYADQPYNITFYEPKYLEKLNIKPSKQPEIVEMKLKGKFADISNVHFTFESDRTALIEQLKQAGYDGAFVKAGIGQTQQGVIWNKDVIKKFGEYKPQPIIESSKPDKTIKFKEIVQERIPYEKLLKERSFDIDNIINDMAKENRPVAEIDNVKNMFRFMADYARIADPNGKVSDEEIAKIASQLSSAVENHIANNEGKETVAWLRVEKDLKEVLRGLNNASRSSKVIAIDTLATIAHQSDPTVLPQIFKVDWQAEDRLMNTTRSTLDAIADSKIIPSQSKPDTVISLTKPESTIKLRSTPKTISMSITQPSEKITKAIKEIETQGYRNPINPRQIIIGDMSLELQQFGDKLYFNIMNMGERGKGQSSKMLDDLIKVASKNDVTLIGDVKPFGKEKGLTKKQLLDWYKRHGFTKTGIDGIERLPDTDK
jgi:hypothetical protein